ncbi:MAG: hypothetical protein HYZ47_03075 [Simkania negevensis]|nr:hypothetical protein [Simkania negevensis]
MQTCHAVQKELITRYAFGKRQWNMYFGDIGEEPPLPSDIGTILHSPCPIWSGKQVRETHLLVLVPATVNGKLLTLESLEELVKKPKKGNATQYRDFCPGRNEKICVEKNTWMLLTRDVLPGSRKQPYDKQVALVGELTKKAKVSYAVPRLIEVATSLFMQHVRSGERLYNDSPEIYTRCQEKYDGQCPVVIGGFSASGVCVVGYDYGNDGVGTMREI